MKKTITGKLIAFVKRETVFCIAMLLAVLSMFLVTPDSEYFSYIDFRTLGILFCLMTVVAGFQTVGLFDLLAGKLLFRIKSMTGICLALTFLCFFLSMFITNDVALITFVPLTLIIMEHVGQELREKWMLKIVVLQTIAANLGSMLTPIGNPQNLYLYGKANISLMDFCRIMLPYSILSLLLLLGFILLPSFFRSGNGRLSENTVLPAGKSDISGKWEYIIAYGVLFTLSLLTVVHILPYEAVTCVVLVYVLFRNRSVLKRIDYSLLGTFLALFVFIGNLGRIPVFREFLSGMINGREVFTAVLASQFMSNVPAAILLSGFTDQTKELIVGTNLGGLGTLIASMASLISYKYIARKAGNKKGKYLMDFTVANCIFLVVLLLFYCRSGAKNL